MSDPLYYSHNTELLRRHVIEVEIKVEIEVKMDMGMDI
jgi:hypothetical protein